MLTLSSFIFLSVVRVFIFQYILNILKMLSAYLLMLLDAQIQARCTLNLPRESLILHFHPLQSSHNFHPHPHPRRRPHRAN